MIHKSRLVLFGIAFESDFGQFVQNSVANLSKFDEIRFHIRPTQLTNAYLLVVHERRRMQRGEPRQRLELRYSLLGRILDPGRLQRVGRGVVQVRKSGEALNLRQI